LPVGWVVVRKLEIEKFPEADRAPGCPHPRETYDLIGHKLAETRFLAAQASGRLHHAWLITGSPGVGKATLAYRIVRHILGGESLLKDSMNIPETDSVAQKVASLGHGNFMLLRRPYDFKMKKLRTEIPVEDVRSLGKFFRGTAAEDKNWRVCLIDSADELNRNSENAILKLLEEPPEKTLILLLSSSPGRLLPTIRSRCMHLPLREVSETEIMPWLRGRVDAPNEIIEAAVKLSRGAPGKAIALVQNTNAVLKPLTGFLKSLDRNKAKIDHIIANSLSTQTSVASRQLFWESLQDVIQAQSVFSVTGEWHGAFKPLPISKSPETWQKLWDSISEMQRIEAAINMDKKTVMLDMLSKIRAA